MDNLIHDILYPPLDALIKKVPQNSRFVLINAAAKRAKNMMEKRNILHFNYKLDKFYDRALEEIYHDKLRIKLNIPEKQDILKTLSEEYL
jgi:DNA-directed RNA polymerase omega subunit